MRLFIAEKPTQAEGLAKVLGGARKTGSHWDTDGGVVVWCYGHMLELAEPDDYDPTLKSWDFALLPILPNPPRLLPPDPEKGRDGEARKWNKRKRDQLEAIGGLLRRASEVVVACDPDRQGDAIARNVIQHFRYNGKVSRLWLASTNEGSVKKALAKLKPGAETEPLWRVALALSEADWLVGMNGTRAVTAKFGGKNYTGIGRVQTATLALIVQRDRAIKNFKAVDYFDLAATVRTTAADEIGLRHTPPEDKRITDRKLAEQIVAAAQGRAVTLAFTEEPKSKAPPKLFTLTTLQGAADARWGWSPDKTLEVAQSLYERHGALSYPRTNCEFLQDDQIGEVKPITTNLVALADFRHLAGASFAPRKVVYDSSKISAHAALTPTVQAPDMGAFSADEKKLYMMVAARFLASLLPDYKYLASKISTEIEGREFATTGTVMVSPGWKAVDEGDEEQDGENKLPKVPDGSAATVMDCKIDAKRTKPPAYYTAKTLLEDMDNIQKYVTNPDHKALLKSKEGKVGSEDRGIGTSATRAEIIKKLCTQGTVELAQRKYRATDRGHELVSYLEKSLPVLVDFGYTAVWEAKLGEIAEGTRTPEAFRAEMHEFVRGMIATLGERANAAGRGGAAKDAGEPTGCKIGGAEILRHVDEKGRAYYTANGGFRGRLYGELWGHNFTAEEIKTMVEGKTVEATDCLRQDKTPAGPKTFRFDAARQPWPGIVAVDMTERESTGVETACKRGKGGAVLRSVTPTGKAYYTVEGVKDGNGFLIKFWEEAFGRQWSAEDVAKVALAGKDGVEFTNMKKPDGTTYSARLWCNPKKKPYAGLDFVG